MGGMDGMGGCSGISPGLSATVSSQQSARRQLATVQAKGRDGTQWRPALPGPVVPSLPKDSRPFLWETARDQRDWNGGTVSPGDWGRSWKKQGNTVRAVKSAALGSPTVSASPSVETRL
ncbi:hypothetical protein FALCPG4_001360 [Fusarium falciforme]